MKNEEWLIRKVDKARAHLVLDNKPQQDTTNQTEIQKQLASARGLLNHFLYNRTANIKKENSGFTMTFDNMLVTLGLSRLPSGVAQNKMDEIVLSLPGISKTETGYTVSNVDLFYENFGPGGIIKKVTELLSKNPENPLSIKEIANELSVTVQSAGTATNGLVSSGKVVVASGQENIWSRGRNKRYKIIDNK